MVEWNGIFRLLRFAGILGKPGEVHPKLRNEIRGNVCSIRSPTRNFWNFWSNVTASLCFVFKGGPNFGASASADQKPVRSGKYDIAYVLLCSCEFRDIMRGHKWGRKTAKPHRNTPKIRKPRRIFPNTELRTYMEAYYTS